MRAKRIYRVKITQCSLNYMWYRNHIGEIFECEVQKNFDTLFVSYTDCVFSYKTIQPIKAKQKVLYKTMILTNGIEKYVRLSEPEYSEIEVQGWILEEDTIILDVL